MLLQNVLLFSSLLFFTPRCCSLVAAILFFLSSPARHHSGPVLARPRLAFLTPSCLSALCPCQTQLEVLEQQIKKYEHENDVLKKLQAQAKLG